MTTSTATLADVARLASVSKMTVSNVINGKPGMSDSTRERVMRAIETTGYAVNPAARILAGGRTNIMGVVVHDLGWHFIGELVGGAGGVAEAAGCDLALYTTHERASVDRQRLAMLRTMTDGLLLVLPTLEEAHTLRTLGPTVAMLAAQDIPPDLPHSVQADNWAGGALAARHLIELGHRRLAHVSGAATLNVLRNDAQERQQGFVAEAARLGVTLAPDRIVPGHFTLQGGEAAAHALLDLPQPPSAIFAANDDSAVGVLRAAQGRGLRVPQDLSIVGFDDVPLAQTTQPQLTTVRQPLQQMGAAAMHTLLGLLDGQQPQQHAQRFATSLIVRSSSGPAPPL